MMLFVRQDIDFSTLDIRELEECRQEITRAIVHHEQFLQMVAFHDSNWILEMGKTAGGWIEAIRKLRVDRECTLKLAKEAVDMVRDSLKK